MAKLTHSQCVCLWFGNHWLVGINLDTLDLDRYITYIRLDWLIDWLIGGVRFYHFVFSRNKSYSFFSDTSSVTAKLSQKVQFSSFISTDLRREKQGLIYSKICVWSPERFLGRTLREFLKGLLRGSLTGSLRERERKCLTERMTNFRAIFTLNIIWSDWSIRTNTNSPTRSYYILCTG